MFELLDENGTPIRLAEIRVALKGNQNQVQQAVQSLVKKGTVEQVIEGRARRYKIAAW